MAKVITIASGKGGVGKTSLSLNLSLALAKAGFKVCLFDGDLGLANVNILTGLYPEHGLAQVIDGQMPLSRIMIKEYNGIDIIPGSSGVEKLADLSARQAKALMSSFLELGAYDYFILDTSAGISAQVLSFCRACQEMVLVATPEPTSLTDAYSLLKVLSRQAPMPRVRVVINQVKTADQARRAYAKLKRTVHKFLSIPISPLGIVAKDPNVSIAVVSQIPFFMLFPETQAARCIRAIVLKLAKDRDTNDDVPIEVFWDQCLELLAQNRKPEASPGKNALSENRLPNPGTGQTEEPAVESANYPALEARLNRMEDKMAQLLDEISQVKALLADAPKAEEPDLREPGKTQEQSQEPHGTRTLEPSIPNPPNPFARSRSAVVQQGGPVHAPGVSTSVFPEKKAIELDFEAWLERAAQKSFTSQ